MFNNTSHIDVEAGSEANSLAKAGYAAENDKDPHTASVQPASDEVQDVWGDLDGDGPNYRGLGW